MNSTTFRIFVSLREKQTFTMLEDIDCLGICNLEFIMKEILKGIDLFEKTKKGDTVYGCNMLSDKEYLEIYTGYKNEKKYINQFVMEEEQRYNKLYTQYRTLSDSLLSIDTDGIASPYLDDISYDGF